MSITDTSIGLGVVLGTPSANGAGAIFSVQSDRFGVQLNADFRARFAAMAAKNMVFSTSTATAGTTIVAANVAPPAAAAATFLSLYNPVGNTYDFEVLFADIARISGTDGAQAWYWCVSAGNTAALTATTTSAATPQAARAGTSTAKAYTQAAITGGLVHTTMRMFPTVGFAAAIAATTPNQIVREYVDGSIVVPPGSVLTLAPGAVGTTVVASASITWAELPITGTGGV